MWRFARLAVMWLVAMALPLQGLSAATMLTCGFGPHDHAPSHMTYQVSHDGIAEANDHGHASEASPHRHASLDDGAGKASLDFDVSQKCSACATCCTSAVVYSEIVSFDAVKLTDFFAPLVARSIAAYVTEGLERPPRTVIA